MVRLKEKEGEDDFGDVTNFNSTMVRLKVEPTDGTSPAWN